MRTDPIKLVQSILTPKTATPETKPKAPETAKSGSTESAAATAPKTKESTTTNAAANASDAYKLSQSLQKKMSRANTSAPPETPDLSTYTAQGLKDHFQSAHESQVKVKSAASAAPKPLDEVLKAAQATGTNEPKLSAAAQESVNEKKATSTDKALSAIDAKLAQTVGVARIIGSA